MSERVTETVDVGGGSQIERSYDVPDAVPGPGTGGSSLRVVSVIADYPAVNGDVVLVDATSGNVVVTLPAATLSSVVYVKKVDSSVHTATIAGTIDGATNLVISTQFVAYGVAADGTEWWVI